MQIIYSTVRFVSPEELDWYLDDCIALKQEFPHLIDNKIWFRNYQVGLMLPLC